MGRNFRSMVQSVQAKAAQRGFERLIVRPTEERECHNVAGNVECLLRVEARGLADCRHFYTEVLVALSQVKGITSYVVMGSPKDDRA